MQVFLPGHGGAAESPANFDLSPSALSESLTTLADQTNIRLLVRSDLVAGRQGRGVHGATNLDDALRRLLAGHPLRHRYLGSRTVIIESAPLPDPTVETRSVTALDPVTAIGYPPPGDGASYNPPDAGTATKTDIPLMEAPFGAAVVPQQVFRDQQLTRIADAVKNVSGVTSKPSGINGDFDFLYLRGFYFGERIYRDGVPIKVGYVNNGQRETANVARVEILKGPPSALYGRTDPGGVVNLVTKQPEREAHHALSQQFGSYDRFRTTLDSTGPITSDRNLSYRVNFAFEKSNSFRDFQYLDRKFFSPVLRWDLSPQTRINVEAEYLELETLSDPGLPLINGLNDIGTPRPGRIPAIPISRFFGSPNDRHTVQEALFGVHGSHEFNKDWTVRHRFNAIFPSTDNDGVILFARSPDLYVVPRSFRESAEVFFNTINLTGHFRHWGVEHTLLLGADYNRATYHWRNQQYKLQRSDLNKPVHPPNWGHPVSVIYSTVPESWLGLYAQDQIKLPYGWQLLAGLRYDDATDAYSESWLEFATGTRGGKRFETRETAVTPRFGLLWRPLPALSWYANYGENFGLPNQRASAAVRALPAERAHQWETGFKTEWLGGRLNLNFAAFRIIKKHVANADTLCTVSGSECTAFLGKAQSQGLEVDMAGEILPQWRFIGNYTYLVTRVLEDRGPKGGPGLTGLPFANNPRHMGNLWTTYEWSEGTLKGFRLGAGATLRGPLTDAVREPGFVLVNLMGGYAIQAGPARLDLQLNIDNLLNKVYYLGSDYWTGDEFPGSPRSVMGRISVEW